MFNEDQQAADPPAQAPPARLRRRSRVERRKAWEVRIAEWPYVLGYLVRAATAYELELVAVDSDNYLPDAAAMTRQPWRAARWRSAQAAHAWRKRHRRGELRVLDLDGLAIQGSSHRQHR